MLGSASGAGIAWSEDPSASRFPTQWLQTPQLNQSWLGQLPFQMPPTIPTSGTSEQTLPITLPPGFKIAQDSVTGQLIMIPSTDIGMLLHHTLPALALLYPPQTKFRGI